MLSKPQFWHVHFNPRSSCEERHVGKRRAVIRDVISIHAPHGGATIPIIAAARLCNSISIHAPHARSDSTACGSTGTIPHFNPRSSCEERLEVAIPRGIDDAFQSTLLMRGATLTLEDKAQLWLISIHAPHARSDQFLVLDIIKILPFQSTLLMRGATRQRQHRRHSSQFQSTLLMRGATRCYYPSCHHSNKFQSTLLMRGATKRHPKPGKTLCISIHAPHARSDIHYPWPDRRTMRISIHAPHARSDSLT